MELSELSRNVLVLSSADVELSTAESLVSVELGLLVNDSVSVAEVGLDSDERLSLEELESLKDDSDSSPEAELDSDE